MFFSIPVERQRERTKQKKRDRKKACYQTKLLNSTVSIVLSMSSSILCAAVHGNNILFVFIYDCFCFAREKIYSCVQNDTTSKWNKFPLTQFIVWNLLNYYCFFVLFHSGFLFSLFFGTLSNFCVPLSRWFSVENSDGSVR